MVDFYNDIDTIKYEPSSDESLSSSYRMLETLWGFPVKMFRTVSGTLSLWQLRIETRNQLVQLDDRLLEDIGLTFSQVQAEIAKPFWKG